MSHQSFCDGRAFVLFQETVSKIQYITLSKAQTFLQELVGIMIPGISKVDLYSTNRIVHPNQHGHHLPPGSPQSVTCNTRSIKEVKILLPVTCVENYFRLLLA
ncbi:hypothetical protein ElyMa_001019100 [Elysia marginata]|uniref:Uncharacterized protein n=1 Tax=Elysia marginata TaxID=1093978 RepID=A0AAV4HJT2_9GAST|nr:hypothetical protein ElyMa_001019100 [Elysia marginata]